MYYNTLYELSHPIIFNMLAISAIIITSTHTTDATNGTVDER
jgi:hypothetical protein